MMTHLINQSEIVQYKNPMCIPNNRGYPPHLREVFDVHPFSVRYSMFSSIIPSPIVGLPIDLLPAIPFYFQVIIFLSKYPTKTHKDSPITDSHNMAANTRSTFSLALA